jgi:hypothetical protein
MDKVNIVFQALDYKQEDPSWANSKIIYVLRCVERNYDVSILVDALSTALGFKIIRHATLATDEKVSVEISNRHSGGYYQAHK